jgi:LuxR family transcriptional regulator, maltose regulon positive regulatory protein
MSEFLSALRGKIEPPVLSEVVPRPHLRDVLSSPERALTLICAPAGWGKTTLLADWAGSQPHGHHVAWLRLERADNDPDRFFAYFLAALATVAPRIGTNSSALLRAPGGNFMREALPVVASEIAAFEAEVILALDDYQVIDHPAINDALASLLEYGPRNLRLTIASRTRPHLPIGRLRVRGDLTELGPEELGFTEAEADVFLNGVHELGLSAHEVALLCERTEGWAAGLHLAVLSLRRGADARSLIGSFAGDDRHVVDYLVSEVLAQASPAQRSFLLRTSVLDRFCARLCHAVTGLPDASGLLDQIERSQYFLVPLDARREWYRHHHLFGDMLCRLFSRESPDEVVAVHRRAAAWFRQVGLESEAIRHSLAAGDVTLAGDLIASSWLTLLNEGRRSDVIGWLDQLPTDLVLSDPRLCSARGWTLFSMGQLGQVEVWADAAQRAAVAGTSDELEPAFAAELATLRASYSLLLGDVTNSRSWARGALELDDAPAWGGVALMCLGTASYWFGDIPVAARELDESIPRSRLTLPLAAIRGLGVLALLEADRQRWFDVSRYVADAFRLAHASGTEEYWMSSSAHLANARLLMSRRRLEEADVAVNRALRLARRGAGPMEVAYALLIAADIRVSRREPASAQVMVREAEEIVEGIPDPGPRLSALVRDHRSRTRRGTAHRYDGHAASDELTARELAVLELLGSELSQRDIARQLFVSLNTVKTHTKSIFRKLGVTNRPAAVARALDRGLLVAAHQTTRPRGGDGAHSPTEPRPHPG